MINFRRIVTPLTLTAALAFGVPAGASASDIGLASTSQCPTSGFCIWGGTNYSGAFASTASTTSTATGVSTAKSVWNRSSRAARVYSGSGGTGTSTCYEPGAMIASTTAASISFRILSTTTC